MDQHSVSKSASGQEAPQSSADPAYDRPAYRWYVTGLMTLIFACHAMDRSMPNILVEPVRHAFNLSDSQLGLYTGVAFGVSFGLFVLPLGYISDRVNRRNFLAVILVLWSLLTTAGGLARNFFQVLALRFGVGAAESGFAPVSLPLVSGIMPPHRRTFAMGVVYMGGAIGGFFAASLGGYVAETHGWRAALFLAGAPGLFLALALLLTVKEPRRVSAGDGAPPPSFGDVAKFLVNKAGVSALIFGCACNALGAIAIGAWSSSFFIRVHHLTLTEVGLVVGAAGSLCSLFAPPFWGLVGDWLAKRARHWPVTAVGMICVVMTAFFVGMLFAPNLILAIGCSVIGMFLLAGNSPIAYTQLLAETPERMHGTVMSILQLASNLLGFGIGPLMIGVLSDYFGGGTAIRYAMASSLIVYLIAAASFFLAVRLIYFGTSSRAAAAELQR